MPFEFELNFTGLCALIYEGADNTKPDRVAVVLPRADHHHGHHKHVPIMSYNPKDLASSSTVQNHHRLVPTPSGDDVAILGLSGRVNVHDPTGSGFSASWDKTGKAPIPGEETSLAWLPPLYGINQNATGLPRPDPSKPNHGLIGEIATIELAGGVLESANLTRAMDDNNGNPVYIHSDFVYDDGSGAGPDTQVVADKLRLRIGGVNGSLEIAAAQWVAKLRPAPLPHDSNGSGRVVVSITNLPEVPDPGFGLRLTHFDHYYNMFPWCAHVPRPRFRLPKLEGYPVTGSSSVCPPTRYDG